MVTDSLRDRIAAVLKAANDRVAGFIGYDEMADAVIEALGMRIQVAGPDGIVGTGNYRYVTEWSNDD
jgi:hypothetical protein